ncbi:unknown [Ruminococcus sp. CAG:254]|nr:unknown [Ruminococcus sp. CAG:254]
MIGIIEQGCVFCFDPSVGIIWPPDTNCLDPSIGGRIFIPVHSCLKNGFVFVSLLLQSILAVFHGDIQFCNLNITANREEFFHCGGIGRNAGKSVIVCIDVGLHPDSIQQALFIEGFAHAVNRIPLVIPVFVIIVVVKLAAFRCVFSGIGKGFFYKSIAAINLHPRGLSADILARFSCSAIVGSSVLVIADALIGNIIGIEIQFWILCLDCLKHIFNVGFHSLIHNGRRNPIAICIEIFFEEPDRGLTVPN